MKIKTAEEILDQFPGTGEYPQLLTRHDAEQACEIYADQFKQKWISVKDRLPENRTYVLIFNVNGTDIAEFKHGCFFVGLERPYSVTHWMELPSAPERKEDGV